MIANDRQQEKLRGIFYELILSSPNHSYDNLLSILTLKLQELFHFSHVAIYVYNNWNKSYELTGGHTEGVFKTLLFNDDEFKTYDHSIIQVNGERVLQETPDLSNSFVIPLRPNNEHTSIIFVSIPIHGELVSVELLNSLKKQLEQFLRVIHYHNRNEENSKKDKFLFDLTSRFYALTNKQDILTEITNALKKLYPDFTFYLLLSQDYDVEGSLPVRTIEYSDDATKRVSTQAFMTGEVQLEDRMHTKNTCLYAPLKGNQGVYGVLQIITPQIVNFPEEEITFIMQFASVAGKAIENVTLYLHSKHLVTDLKMINDVTHKLNSNLKRSEITAIVKQKIVDVCSASQVGFAYYQEEKGNNFDMLSGSTDFFYSKEGFDFTEHILDKMKSNKEPIFSGDYTNVVIELPFRSVMAIPMLHSGMIHGVIIIMHEEGYFFSFDNFKLMQSLIQHSTLALANSILKDRLESAVITDYLTKLYSRNYLDEKIQEHITTGEKGALILFDIDDFKKVNDRYGHYIGDEVIKQVAKIIKMHLGKNDIPARWGGEELAIYLPNASIDDGVKMASQIRKQAEHDTDPMITLSCGVSTWSDKSNDSVQAVFIQADKALYEAKSIGKNCVVNENVLIKD
ncbi:sensor domain-containing diguanylate cyclase [Lentibacillus sp. Marseille-P4043]|uniref:sensor domain-containing diguanylate cyclase n=1 Tax=Lentibacillus sp. Marseille-P4043 TaxID=2040293 RepID=UPI00131A5BD5|nr:sensor domain-containing diguanylate cyclase [Lentibacillus sp. Marseille-P4043]